MPWRWQQRPRSRHRTAPRAGAALRAGRDSPGPIAAGGAGRVAGRGTRAHPAPWCQNWHGRAMRGRPGNAAPAAFSVPAPGLLDLRCDGAGGKTSGFLPGWS